MRNSGGFAGFCRTTGATGHKMVLAVAAPDLCGDVRPVAIAGDEGVARLTEKPRGSMR